MRNGLPQHGLVANHQHSPFGARPLHQLQQLGGGAARQQFGAQLVFTAQRDGGLFGAARGAAEHTHTVGQLAVEPGGHTRRLFFTTGRQRALQVFAVVGFVLGFGVAPQNQVHHRLSSVWGGGLRRVVPYRTISASCAPWPLPSALART